MNVDKLIKSVYERRTLWDQKDSQHHNRYILDKKWDEVAIKMNTTRQIVRSKWKSLRDTFRKELQRNLRPRSETEGSSYKSSWRYYDNLSFLQDQFTTKSYTGNLSEVNSNSMDNTLANETTPDDLEDFDVKSEATSSSPSINIENSAPQKRKRPTNEIGDALIQLEERKLAMLEKNHMQSLKKVDEDEAFFNSLLPHVRPLPQMEKLLLRIKIQQLIYDFITSLGQQPSHSQPAIHKTYPGSPTNSYSGDENT